MKINHKNCTIELTKTEMKEAETFGSQMYKDLREARQDNPKYRVKVVSSGKKVDHHKGLTADAMKNQFISITPNASQTSGANFVLFNQEGISKLSELAFAVFFNGGGGQDILSSSHCSGGGFLVVHSNSQFVIPVHNHFSFLLEEL